MSADEERGYLRLIMHLWGADDCAILVDDKLLSRVTLLGRKWYGPSGKKILACLIAHPTLEGHLTHHKVLRLKEKLLSFKGRMSSAGKASAAKRAVNKRSTQRATQAQQESNIKPNIKSNYLSLSLSKEETPYIPLGGTSGLDEEELRRISNSQVGAKVRTEMLPDPFPPDSAAGMAWTAWLKYLPTRVARVSQDSLQMQLLMVSEMGPERTVAAVRYSIRSNYASLVEPKPERPSGPPEPASRFASVKTTSAAERKLQYEREVAREAKRNATR